MYEFERLFFRAVVRYFLLFILLSAFLEMLTKDLISFKTNENPKENSHHSEVFVPPPEISLPENQVERSAFKKLVHYSEFLYFCTVHQSHGQDAADEMLVGLADIKAPQKPIGTWFDSGAFIF